MAATMTTSPTSTWPATLTRTGVIFIVVGLVLALLAALVNRFGLLKAMGSLGMLSGGLLMLVIGTLLAVIGLLTANAKGIAISKGSAALAIVVALVVIGYVLSWVQTSQNVAMLHEVSTDLESPPPFVEVKKIRDAIPGLNPSEYVAELKGRNGVINVPEQQRKFYPDLQPLILPAPPAETFAKIEATARSMGWTIVAAVPAEGRLEATDTTRFFGFKDDIVVRLRAQGSGSRVDVRSKSRVGLGDVGTNAKRVRAYLAALRSG